MDKQDTKGLSRRSLFGATAGSVALAGSLPGRLALGLGGIGAVTV